MELRVHEAHRLGHVYHCRHGGGHGLARDLATCRGARGGGRHPSARAVRVPSYPLVSWRVVMADHHAGTRPARCLSAAGLQEGAIHPLKGWAGYGRVGRGVITSGCSRVAKAAEGHRECEQRGAEQPHEN
jgi:hypothetical protein